MDIYKKVKELIELMNEAEIDEIEIKDGLREVRLTKHLPGIQGGSVPVFSQPVSAGFAQPAPSAEQGAPAAAGEPAAPALDKGVVEFKSPMVGTFYRAPSPESPPFVAEGEKVNKESVLCIIEAMKVMNEIKAETSGEVVDVLVENGEAVEFGQPLFLIKATK